MNETMETVDVLVVGAGPSGLTLAAALAREGVRALTVDRHPGTSIFPKATGVRLRTMEILRSWGVADRVPEHSRDVRLVMSVQPTIAGPQLQSIPLGVPEDGLLQAASPSHFLFCAQDRLEPILLDHARSRGADVRFRTEVTDLTIGDDGVTARLCPTEGAPAYVVRARYVVGADGGDSVVRRAAGIDWHSLGSEGHHLAALFRGDLSPAVRGRAYALYATVAPGSEGMFVTTGDPERWVFDQEWRPDEEPLDAWTPERVRDAIRAASGLPDLDPLVEGLFPWEFGAAVAKIQQKGRVFLIGDAAHRTTPRRATGMNTGIADAHNLGWKLAWVLAGWAGPDLLESYDVERRPVGHANALRSLQPSAEDAEDRDLLADDLAVVYRSEVVAETFAESCARPDSESPVTRAVPGGRAPHAWVERDGSRISLLDLYDRHLTVVTGPGGTSWRSAATALAAEGLPVQVVRLGVDVTDDHGLAAARYAVGDSGAVLVRPDGHVAALLDAVTGDAEGALRSACDRALGWGGDPAEAAIAV